MLFYELEKLIKSLSATEKKIFQLHGTQLKGDKDYVILYEQIIGQIDTVDGASWQERFREAYPTKSLENTAAYLYKILTDLLVQIRIEQDTWYQQYQCLLKARLCFERSIPSRAFKELHKASKLATASQHHPVAYQAARMELTALSDLGFPGLSEQQLVDKQMKAKHTLQSLRQIHEHYSLYELLSHRLTKGKRPESSKQDKQVNDLILSELSLSTRGSQHQFEPQKLHLLFQSFFFIHSGEYRSALRIFNELTKLTEANESMWDYPPYDYLSALDGILDSLRSIGYYQEMAPFIDRLATLSERAYPEHFKSVATLTTWVYQLNMLLGCKKYEMAAQLIGNLSNGDTQKAVNGHEKQLEYYFFIALTYFMLQQWSKAKKQLNLLIAAAKQTPQHLAYRAGRLLHILLSYEMDDLGYVEYEIRSYKRAFSKQGKAYKTEKLIFNTIAADPKLRGNAWKATAHKKVAAKLKEIITDKRELQLTKFADFGQWVLASLSHK
ncbi:hypothetical protein [Parapedobacter indicus]|uniref:Uncharacterized protein n=1 Tax=Parapedobacter indicus TaxID=1477437 RepID=A0A1I3S407_9SPHI|nr:hypothetical protein [Parapedobacter indicus]PPK99876.1 hypothetical protein CLV26_1106 [Parapedobacter indicus]SFJ53090.1 hypothetical protein SAMN05444682_110239 [Parapedobacter indicus]